MKKLIILLALCGSCVSPDTAAEQATFDAVAPEYLTYVEADEALTEEQKQLRRDTIETWRRRLEAAK